MASPPFLAGSYVTLYVAGYPGTPGVRLAVENLQSHRQLPLQFGGTPAESWCLYHFALPRHWKGQPVRVLAEDSAARLGGWLGFAEVPPAQARRDQLFALHLLTLVLAMVAVTVLPPVAACVIGALKGVKASLDLIAIALLTMGLVGYAAFWGYFLNRTVGVAYSYVVLSSSMVVIVWGLSQARRRLKLGILRRLLLPLVLLSLASVFVTSLGFVYGEPSWIQDYAAQRFVPWDLPIDNFLPKILADGVYQGHIPKPMLGDWESSDRPPLQAGMALWHYAWTHGKRDLPYQVLGTVFQLTFLVGLWAYLNAAGISRKAMALVFPVALFSGFTILNSFFVWPKLLPAAFLLIVAAYLLTRRYGEVRANWQAGVVVGVAAALAMLCHGGSAFGLLGLAATMIVLRRVPSLRFVLAATLAAGLLYLPWFLYQKYYDPPGDRLLKWHLAGVQEAHPNAKLRDLLISNYKKLGWEGTKNTKIQNFEILFGVSSSWRDRTLLAKSLFAGNRQQRPTADALFRRNVFFLWSWSIDLFIFAPLALFVCAVLGRRRSPEYQQACILWLATGLTLVLWCILMYRGTVVHQGCYFTEIAAFAAGVLGLWALSPRLAVIVAACHIVFSLAAYAFLSPPPAIGVGSYFGNTSPVLIAVSAIAGLAFVAVLWGAAGRPERDDLFAGLAERDLLAAEKELGRAAH
jgi:hypothetical protein